MKSKINRVVILVATILLGASSVPVVVSGAPVTDTEDTVINVDVAEVITIDSTSGTVSINATPGGGDYTGTDTILVSTNDAAGYTLNLKDSDTVTNLVSGGNTIAAMTVAVACSAAWTNDEALADNEWGFKADALGDASQYCPILTSAGSGNDIASSGSPVTSDSTTVTYAVKVTAVKPAGTYTDTVLYTATGGTP